MGYTVFQMLLHVIWSFVDPLEITCDDLLNPHAVFDDFRLPILIFLFDFRHDWVVPLDPEDLVGNLVELLHFAFPQQLAKVLYVLGLFEGPSNRKLF